MFITFSFMFVIFSFWLFHEGFYKHLTSLPRKRVRTLYGVPESGLLFFSFLHTLHNSSPLGISSARLMLSSVRKSAYLQKKQARVQPERHGLVSFSHNGHVWPSHTTRKPSLVYSVSFTCYTSFANLKSKKQMKHRLICILIQIILKNSPMRGVWRKLYLIWRGMQASSDRFSQIPDWLHAIPVYKIVEKSFLFDLSEPLIAK